MVVGDIERRVVRIHVAEEVGELGLITCVWCWVSHSARLTPASGRAWAVLAMDVVDAEGLDDGTEGEHKTRRNGRYSTFNKRHHETRWMRNTVNDAQLILPWADVCPHWKFADDALWCSHEITVRVCASNEVVPWKEKWLVHEELVVLENRFCGVCTCGTAEKNHWTW